MTMSCAINSLLQPLYVSTASLLSSPSIFSSRVSYPILPAASRPANLRLLCSCYSITSNSLLLKKTGRPSTLMAWAQQDESTASVVDGEGFWESNGSLEDEVSDLEGGVEAVGDAGESSSSEEEDGEESYGEPPEDAKVFVGNLSYDIDSETLATLFDQAGIVEVAEVIYNRETDQSRGFGFVTMSTVEEAEKAVKLFNSFDLKGRLLTVNKAARRGERPERVTRSSAQPSPSIYVGNLPWSVDGARLEEVFSEHGKVVNARVVMDRDSGRSKGFGFVTMSSEDELNHAISSLDGHSLDGRTMRVNVAQERPNRGF